jgi:hypothetical protein
MPVRLHSGGRVRAWLGARAGDPTAGDRILRRLFHAVGVLVLLVYLLPPEFFVVLPTRVVLLLALLAVLTLEGVRMARGVELPMIRPWEAENRRPASYAYFAVALVVAVLWLPAALGTAVVLGGAWADPLAGELRARGVRPSVSFALPTLFYGALAFAALRWVGGWTVPAALATGLAAGVLGILVERPKWKWVDDDLLIILVPAALLAGLVAVWPALPMAGG